MQHSIKPEESFLKVLTNKSSTKNLEKEQLDKLKDAAPKTFKSKEGLIMLKWIAAYCYFGRGALSFDKKTGEVNVLDTLVRAQLQEFYLELCQFLDRDTLIKVQYGEKKEKKTQAKT